MYMHIYMYMHIHNCIISLTWSSFLLLLTFEMKMPTALPPVTSKPHPSPATKGTVTLRGYLRKRGKKDRDKE